MSRTAEAKAMTAGTTPLAALPQVMALPLIAALVWMVSAAILS